MGPAQGSNGVDWSALRTRYAKLLDDAVTRWDVNFVLGEFIGELNASHTYRGGGDEEKAPQRNVGMLGVDWELSSGAYRITTATQNSSVHRQRRAAEHEGRSVGELPGAG